MRRKNLIPREILEKDDEIFYRTVSGRISETEVRRTQKREEFENVRQRGARLTKHRFSY